MKKLLLIATLLVGPALVLAQGGGRRRPARATPAPSSPAIPTGRDRPCRSVRPIRRLTPAASIRRRSSSRLPDQWTSYSGDLSGKRFSPLKLVNTATVKNLSLKWINTLTTGCGPTGTAPVAAGRRRAAVVAAAAVAAAAGGGGAADRSAPIIVGGLGTGEANNCGNRAPGGGILFVDGIIYAGSPFNVYAIDARDGTILWHYYWKTRGGTALQTRGVGMWRNYVYFTMHDNWVVCLDAKTGKEVWRHEIAPHDQQYFSSNAPMVIGDHILVGTGNDLDAPSFLKSLDPRTGAVEWILYSTPQNQGDPGLETWASLDAARHGNGATWIPGVYDPETKLYIYGTGNPTPSYTQGRGEGDNLFTSRCLSR